MRKLIDVLKDSCKAIKNLGGLDCDESGNSDYEWLDDLLKYYINELK